MQIQIGGLRDSALNNTAFDEKILDIFIINNYYYAIHKGCTIL